MNNHETIHNNTYGGPIISFYTPRGLVYSTNPRIIQRPCARVLICFIPHANRTCVSKQNDDSIDRLKRSLNPIVYVTYLLFVMLYIIYRELM